MCVASSLYSSHAGLQVLSAAAAPIKRGRGRPKKAASSDNEPAPTATKKPRSTSDVSRVTVT